MTAAESPPPVVDADALAGVVEVLVRHSRCRASRTERGSTFDCGITVPITLAAHHEHLAQALSAADLLAATPGEGAKGGLVRCVCGSHLVPPYPNDTGRHSTTECPPGEGAALSEVERRIAALPPAGAGGFYIRKLHALRIVRDVAARATAADPLKQAVEALVEEYREKPEATSAELWDDLRRVLDGNGNEATP